MIYMNAASHGLPDAAVRARMMTYLKREAEIGPDAAEIEAIESFPAIRDNAARVIGARPEDVVLVGTTTIGWNAAVLSLPLAGRRVLVAPGEWSSDVAVLMRAGAVIEVMAETPEGALDLDALARQIDEDVALIAAPMVCSLTGERYPVAQIGTLPRPDGTLFAVDAAQAVGQVPVSVTDLGCDILAATTRKWLRGPRDTALLYVAPHVFERMRPNPAPRIFGITVDGATISDKPGVARFDPNSTFAPQRLGLGVALERFLADPDGAMAALAAPVARLRAAARAAGFALACEDDSRATAIITLRGPTGRMAALASELDAAGVIYTAPSPGCEPLRPAHTVEGAFLRLSPHVYNTQAEIDGICRLIGSA